MTNVSESLVQNNNCQYQSNVLTKSKFATENYVVTKGESSSDVFSFCGSRNIFLCFATEQEVKETFERDCTAVTFSYVPFLVSMYCD